MAIEIKNGAPFTKEPGDRPGLYVRFVQKAIASIGMGARSKAATVKYNFTGGTAAADKVYRITSIGQAETIFGKDNIEDIVLFFQGGASEVVVSTVDGSVAEPTWQAALERLETYKFHVFALPFAAADGLKTAATTWIKTAASNGKNFVTVFADEANEGDIAKLKTTAQTKADESVVFVSGGVVNPDGTELSADKYAIYIAGLIAGTPINGSLTYQNVPFAETITRYRNPEVKELLAAGLLVTVMDGDRPRIEQGLTLGTENEFNKIRTVRAKQAMIDDINAAVNESYIGKITNSPDGQIAVMNAIKAYLETLANAQVVDRTFTVELDPEHKSEGADLYIKVGVKFLDSIEYVYLTVVI